MLESICIDSRTAGLLMVCLLWFIPESVYFICILYCILALVYGGIFWVVVRPRPFLRAVLHMSFYACSQRPVIRNQLSSGRSTSRDNPHDKHSTLDVEPRAAEMLRFASLKGPLLIRRSAPVSDCFWVMIRLQ